MVCEPFRPSGSFSDHAWQDVPIKEKESLGWKIQLRDSTGKEVDVAKYISPMRVFVNGKDISIEVTGPAGSSGKVWACYIAVSPDLLILAKISEGSANWGYCIYLITPPGSNSKTEVVWVKTEVVWVPLSTQIDPRGTVNVEVSADRQVLFLSIDTNPDAGEATKRPWYLALVKSKTGSLLDSATFDDNGSSARFARLDGLMATYAFGFQANPPKNYPLREKPGTLPLGKLEWIDPANGQVNIQLASSGSKASTSGFAILQLKNTGADCIKAAIQDGLLFKVEDQASLKNGVGVNEIAKVTITFTCTDPNKDQSEMLTLSDITGATTPITINCQGGRHPSGAIGKIIETSQFPDIILGGGKSSTGTFKIQNNTMPDLIWGPLDITSVTPGVHFEAKAIELFKDGKSRKINLTAGKPDLPISLEPGEAATIHVRFLLPQAAQIPADPVPAWVESLAIAYNPDNPPSDRALPCSARSVPPQIAIVAQPDMLDFGPIWVDRPGALPFSIVNSSNVPVRLDIPGPTAGDAPFAWKPQNKSLDERQSPPAFDDPGVSLCAQAVGTVARSLTASAEPPEYPRYRTSIAVPLRADALRMPPDTLGGQTWASPILINLRMPPLVGDVWDRSLAAEGCLKLPGPGAEKHFVVTYQCRQQDDHCGGGGSYATGLGFLMTIKPPKLRVELGLERGTHSYDRGRVYAAEIKIHSSDLDGSRLIKTSSSGYLELQCPTGALPDHTCHVTICNPTYAQQGPTEFGISFSYSTMDPELSSTQGPIPAKYIKLKRYFDMIWLGDPVLDRVGRVIADDDWRAGQAVVVTDIRGFLRRHIEFVSDSEILLELTRYIDRGQDHVLGAELLFAGETAWRAGLATEARRYLQKSAALFRAGALQDGEARALRGLQRLLVIRRTT
jgi:hypothetical protein